MHASLLLMVAVSGLGCQNKVCQSVDIPPAAYGVIGGDPSAARLPSYYTYSAGFATSEFDDGFTVHDSLRDTFYSFIFGRSRGVPTPHDMEASVPGYDVGP